MCVKHWSHQQSQPRHVTPGNHTKEILRIWRSMDPRTGQKPRCCYGSLEPWEGQAREVRKWAYTQMESAKAGHHPLIDQWLVRKYFLQHYSQELFYFRFSSFLEHIGVLTALPVPLSPTSTAWHIGSQQPQQSFQQENKKISVLSPPGKIIEELSSYLR